MFFFTQLKTEARLSVPLVKFLDWNLLWGDEAPFPPLLAKSIPLICGAFACNFLNWKSLPERNPFYILCLKWIRSVSLDFFHSFRFVFFFFLCEICSTRIYFYRDLCATIDIEVNKLKASLCQKPEIRNRKSESKSQLSNPTQSLFKLSSSAAKAKNIFVSFFFSISSFFLNRITDFTETKRSLD